MIFKAKWLTFALVINKTETKTNKIAEKMGKKIKFTKMHGAGNDYIYIDTSLYDIADPEAVSIKLSDRHKGIGGDGIVLIGKPYGGVQADFSMRIFNADGSEAMMCGNASRCIGKYVHDRGLTNSDTIRLQTLSGVKTLRLHLDNEGCTESVTVDMLEPRMQVSEQYDEAYGGTLVAAGRTFQGTFVSMGNPHFVTFVDDIDTIDITLYGSLMERDKAFPGRCNIEFAQVRPDGIRTRVWERGSGITLACGTGACATAVAAAATGRATRQSDIVMDGGTLHIEWNEADGHVYMTGGATFVFDGETTI